MVDDFDVVDEVEEEVLEEDEEEVIVDDLDDADEVEEEKGLDEELVEDLDVVSEAEVDIGEVVFVVDEIVDVVGIKLELVLVVIRKVGVIEEDVVAIEEDTVVEDEVVAEDTELVVVDDWTKFARLGEVELPDVDVPIAFWYMLRRDGPPQYSVALALHIILHCVSADEVPGTSTEPALIVFPHYNSVSIIAFKGFCVLKRGSRPFLALEPGWILWKGGKKE
ncbi:MAG: hypothetical protein Q9209_002978 [Squamulea sp. 1 TL-2023]